jgi:hypothetical protein
LIVVLLTEQGLTMDNRTKSRLKISEVQLMKSECDDKLIECLKKREEIYIELEIMIDVDLPTNLLIVPFNFNSEITVSL